MDKLPLLPEKEGVVCADVRPVLREVFRELDYLPPLVVTPNNLENSAGDWIDNYKSECEQICHQEGQLMQEFAAKLAREPKHNIYKLHSRTSISTEETWKGERGIILRKDLKPWMERYAGCGESLWVKNILNRSSSNIRSAVKESESKLQFPIKYSNEYTSQSLSIGELVPQKPPPPPLVSPPPPEPEYIICVPPQLEFVNFTVGEIYTQTLRLINTSKFEIRISIRPPSRRELDLELCSRLVVTSGAAAEIRVHFRPSDVRVLKDEILVRVCSGRGFSVPVQCYMEPPLLEITVPNATSSKSAELAEARSDVIDLGSKLLGEVHRVPFLLHCKTKHAQFFLLSEESWLNYSVDVSLSTKPGDSSISSDKFLVSSACWSGGKTPGLVICRAATPGLQTTTYRILCSTAIQRTLQVIADSVMFRPDHVTIKAQEKDYDICSEEDRACEYYVHLGTAFSRRSLTASIQIINHSSVSYSYYWSVRPWSVCSCKNNGEGDNSDCPGLKYQVNQEEQKEAELSALALHVEKHGSVSARDTNTVDVCVPDVGERQGVQRAVLMLVLKNIPKESFASDYDPMIKRTELIHEDCIPGVSEAWSREICDVVCAQLEVWWEVVPVCFVLDPPVVPLMFSRRMKSVPVTLRATQLFGVAEVNASWKMTSSLPPLRLDPADTIATSMVLPLPEIRNELPEMERIVLEADTKEWSTSCSVIRSCRQRHPSLRPAILWLGVVPPGAKVRAQLTVCNDTYQHIYWWATPYRWYRENEPSAACVHREPCAGCRQRACSCSLLRHTRGALASGAAAKLEYDVLAPLTSGVVATLIQVKRTEPDTSYVVRGTASDARASLVVYRVLAPKVVLRVLPCFGDKKQECEGCVLDNAAGRGAPVLRPRRALPAAARACYRLRCTNITPIPTTVKWEVAGKGNPINVIIIPNEYDVGAYATVEAKLVLEAARVCSRRVFVYKASVEHAERPLYLLIDTAVAGLEVHIDIPLGGEEKATEIMNMRLTEKEESLKHKNLNISISEQFAEEDRKRKIQNDNIICHCRYKMVYVPPVKRPQPPPKNPEDYAPIDIVSSPPPLTRVCKCCGQKKPVLLQLQEPPCLQFKQLPTKTSRSRTIVLRNTSDLSTSWQVSIRRYPRVRTRSLPAGQWASDVRDPGVAIQCAPSTGQLPAKSRAQLVVTVYADCWGLYYDQILVLIENLEPVVVDVWIEAVGTPLQFAMGPTDQTSEPPTLWMSSSDRLRGVRASNTSRADLIVYAYIVREHEYQQQRLPFRLYLRLYDVAPRVCPCVTEYNSNSIDEERSNENLLEDMDTGVELFLAADYGVQDDTFYRVERTEAILKRGAAFSWNIRLLTSDEPALPGVLLLRAVPIQYAGDHWWRVPPAPQVVRLRATNREPRLQTTRSELRIALCALDLPMNDVLRIRKTFRIKNTGNGPLQAEAVTEAPWSVFAAPDVCDAACLQPATGDLRSDRMEIYLPGMSSAELCAEVSVRERETWPPPGEQYPPRRVTTTPLRFFDQDHVLLMTMPLTLDLDLPLLTARPASLDFGFVSCGDSRKTYFTVSHSSRSATVELKVTWTGHAEFSVWPPNLRVPPDETARVYVQYTARWRSGAAGAEGAVRVSGGARCGASVAEAEAEAVAVAVAVAVRATPAADRACAAPPHDHTDDPTLLPSCVKPYEE